MNQALEKALTGAGGQAIRVDIDALWRKAIEQSHEDKRSAQKDADDPMRSMNEFAVLSSWARGKGKKS